MLSQNLESLVKTGILKSEPANQGEFNGLLRSAKARLTDSTNPSLAIESRFDLAYNASHALALAALRWHGFRSDNRYIVFQCLEHTLNVKPEIWRVLAHCHQRRNVAEYEGHLEVSDQLLAELIGAADLLQKRVEAMTPVKPALPGRITAQTMNLWIWKTPSSSVCRSHLFPFRPTCFPSGKSYSLESPRVFQPILQIRQNLL